MLLTEFEMCVCVCVLDECVMKERGARVRGREEMRGEEREEERCLYQLEMFQ